MLARRKFLRLLGGASAPAFFMGGNLLSTMSHAAIPFGLPDGFFVPAEEQPHERTFMQWPTNTRVHTDSWFLAQLQQTIANIANTIVEFEPVVMLADKSKHKQASKLLSNSVSLWDVPTDDLWCRDSGPLFAINGEGKTAISRIAFNGWGNKQIHANDALVADHVAKILGMTTYESGLFGEPGGIEWDGHGTLLAHESSWVNPNRNALSKREIEERLLAAYGAETMIWAPGVTGLDITDDHIDALARFVHPAAVLFQMPFAEDRDPFSVSARETLSILQKSRNTQGQALQVIEIPSPTDTRVMSDDFVASYANYYVCNGAIICAQFGDSETDQIVFATLSDLYPEREIIALNIDPLGEIGGGIHCATQQQPKA